MLNAQGAFAGNGAALQFTRDAEGRITEVTDPSGRKVKYAYTDKEKDKIVKEVGEKASLQRYKGLGEMNPTQLWETTMNPENRTLLLVTVEDAAESDRTFDMLMGDAVDPRRKFIQTHAKAVRNLDI